ncbi:MAG: hypothetical protein R2769_11975 [Saprospiraceae bacterium]
MVLWTPTKNVGVFEVSDFANNAFFNKMTIIGAFQRIDEDRYERELDKLWRQYTLENVYVGSLTADFDKRFGESSVLTYGLDTLVIIYCIPKQDRLMSKLRNLLQV